MIVVTEELQHYRDPNGTTTTGITVKADMLPLPEGCLLENFGFPLIVVCNKVCCLVDTIALDRALNV